MARNYKLSKIKTKRSYLLKEIADMFNVHVRTVQSWIKSGLEPLEGTKSPYYVMGYDLKDYLSKQNETGKVKLKNREFYCLACKKGVVPTHIEVLDNGIVGNNMKSFRLKGSCPICKLQVNRIASQSSLTNLGVETVETGTRIIWDLEQPLKQ